MAGAFLPWEKWLARLLHPLAVAIKRWAHEVGRRRVLERSLRWPLSAASPSQTVFSIGYDFHLLNSGDNGNVWAITNYKDTTRNQTFSYDTLNRLTSAQTAGSNCSAPTANGKNEYWGNSYAYDAWGNLLSKTVTKCSAENLSVTALPNNQLSGYGYDAAGNMTHDLTFGHYYSYDAESRITQVDAGVATHTYNAEGNRVRKDVSGSPSTEYFYFNGQIIGEIDPASGAETNYIFFDGKRVARRDATGSVEYYFSDHLKTASVITDAVGNIQSESDYYPWGSELQLINNDSNHYKFTGKERDEKPGDSGLDYFGARYYSNGLGRFVTPDWAAKATAVPYADFGDPQSLNLYSYVKNNPMSLEDPDGHGIRDWLKEKGCSLGFSSLCATPPPPPQDPKPNLVNAQDAARNDPSLQKDKDGTTHCIQATCQIVGKTGAPTGPLVGKDGKPVSANQQATNLANSNDYREVTPEQAQDIANKGGTVIVGYNNPNGHGHTATVRPEGVPGDNPPPGGQGPLINDIGNKDRVQNANWAFRKDADVHYDTPK